MFVSTLQVYITWKSINLLKILGRLLRLTKSREKQSFSVPLQVQKSPGLDELRVRNSLCCTAHNLWFSVLRTSSRDASAVGTSLDSIIQPAAEGNHRPQVPGLMLTVQHSQTRHQPSLKVMLDKEGAWLGSSSSITPQAIGDSN